MATLTEAVQACEEKRGKFSEFMKANSDEVNGERNWHFKAAGQEDGLKAFKGLNDEMAEAQDKFNAIKSVEDTARRVDMEGAEMRRPNRQVPYNMGDEGEMYGRPAAVKSLADLFMESEEFQANAEKSLSTLGGTWKTTLKGASAQRTLDAEKAVTIGSGNVLPYAQQPARIVPYATRRPVVRSLMQVVDPENNFNLQMIRENLWTNNTEIVPEGGLKPLNEIGTERVPFTLEAVAGAFKVTNQALRFIPGIRERINRMGSLGILQKEEDYVLNYDGTAGWKGFYKQTGVQASALGAQDPFTAFHAGMVLIQDTPGYASVTGGLIHPNNWHAVVTTKDGNGRFIYGDPSAAEQAPRLWGVPLVPTSAATEGIPIIGDFENFAQLWVDPTMTVMVTYENDDARRNQQTIIIEEFMALEISRPAAFVKLTGWNDIPLS